MESAKCPWQSLSCLSFFIVLLINCCEVYLKDLWKWFTYDLSVAVNDLNRTFLLAKLEGVMLRLLPTFFWFRNGFLGRWVVNLCVEGGMSMSCGGGCVEQLWFLIYLTGPNEVGLQRNVHLTGSHGALWTMLNCCAQFIDRSTVSGPKLDPLGDHPIYPRMNIHD